MQNQCSKHNSYCQCYHSPTDQVPAFAAPWAHDGAAQYDPRLVICDHSGWALEITASQRSIYWLVNKGKCTQEPVFRKSLKNPHPYFTHIPILHCSSRYSLGTLPQTCHNKRPQHSWSGGFPEGVSWIKVADLKAPGAEADWVSPVP